MPAIYWFIFEIDIPASALSNQHHRNKLKDKPKRHHECVYGKTTILHQGQIFVISIFFCLFHHEFTFVSKFFRFVLNFQSIDNLVYKYITHCNNLHGEIEELYQFRIDSAQTTKWGQSDWKFNLYLSDHDRCTRQTLILATHLLAAIECLQKSMSNNHNHFYSCIVSDNIWYSQRIFIFIILHNESNHMYYI